MPTYEDCRDAGILRVIGGNLRARQLPQRILLAVPEVIVWMQEVLPGLPSDGYVPGAARPLEQAATLARGFIAGDDLDPPDPHMMAPQRCGIWRLRTPDLRFDGWFPRKRMFVIGSLDSKSNTLTKNDEIVAAVVALRESIGLDDGIFEEAVDINELL